MKMNLLRYCFLFLLFCVAIFVKGTPKHAYRLQIVLLLLLFRRQLSISTTAHELGGGGSWDGDETTNEEDLVEKI